MTDTTNIPLETRIAILKEGLDEAKREYLINNPHEVDERLGNYEEYLHDVIADLERELKKRKVMDRVIQLLQDVRATGHVPNSILASELLMDLGVKQ